MVMASQKAATQEVSDYYISTYYYISDTLP